MTPTRRLSILIVLFLAAGGLLGGVLGGRALAEPQKADDQLWRFGRVVSLIEDQFVGEVDSKALIDDAIEGLLRTLDPHSNYLDAESFREMRDEQRGKFSGLGIQITKRGPDKPLTVIAPIDDTPAYRAGLLSGDVISKIEDKPTIELSVQQAVQLLKGEKGTRVTITIQRPGTPEPFDVTIERDDIPIDSIRVAFMLPNGVGYVRIFNFTSTTAEELDDAVAHLKSEGMTKLLLDLRGNPGGLLDQAVKVSERFIPEDKLVVYTRGRIPGSDQDYVASKGVERIDLPLIVLVDQSSASASEIVSGAIQDHDRGLVVGQPTFGKGLVQRVIPLQAGGALAVTTAKYYTPSGRLIQRDYSDLEEYYLHQDEEIAPAPTRDEEKGPGDARVQPQPEVPAAPAPTEVFYTASGRKVYGGGGIRPDHLVQANKMPEILLGMIRENVLFDYAVLYANQHPNLTRDFAVDDAVLADFRAHLDRRPYTYDAKAFDEAKDAIGLRLRAQIARVKWNQIEEARALAAGDPQVSTALGLFDEAAELSQRAREDKDGKPHPAFQAHAAQPTPAAEAPKQR
jgi:carboxyl-terminal processing protease